MGYQWAGWTPQQRSGGCGAACSSSPGNGSKLSYHSGPTLSPGHSLQPHGGGRAEPGASLQGWALCLSSSNEVAPEGSCGGCLLQWAPDPDFSLQYGAGDTPPLHPTAAGVGLSPPSLPLCVPPAMVLRSGRGGALHWAAPFLVGRPRTGLPRSLPDCSLPGPVRTKRIRPSQRAPFPHGRAWVRPHRILRPKGTGCKGPIVKQERGEGEAVGPGACPSFSAG